VHTAHEDLGVLLRTREVFYNLLLADEPDTTGPSRRRIIEHVVYLEPLGVLAGEAVELFPEQDVLNVHVGVYERKECGIGGVLENGADDLLSRARARQTRDRREESLGPQSSSRALA
jgi:hypothetical protein